MSIVDCCRESCLVKVEAFSAGSTRKLGSNVRQRHGGSSRLSSHDFQAIARSLTWSSGQPQPIEHVIIAYGLIMKNDQQSWHRFHLELCFIISGSTIYALKPSLQFMKQHQSCKLSFMASTSRAASTCISYPSASIS